MSLACEVEQIFDGWGGLSVGVFRRVFFIFVSFRVH